MSIWFFLWLILTITLLSFFGWTMYILYRQKVAWQVFAKKSDFRYKSSSLLASPEMTGTIEDYSVDIFTGEHETEDARGLRRLNAVEIKLKNSVPFEGVIASGGMTRLVDELDFSHVFKPEIKGWSGDVKAADQGGGAMAAYLTDKRMKALQSLMKIKAGWVILIFRENTALLRFDTPDPLDSVKKLEQIVQQMLKVVKVLEISEGEAGGLKSKSQQPKRSRDAVELDIEDDRPVSLELEEDEDQSEAEEKPSTENS